MPGWEERRGAGGFKERSRQGEGETGSKAHQTVRLFTHEPQARYSRVSVECQHGLPVQIQLQLLGSRRREKQPYKMTSHATDSDFIETHSSKPLSYSTQPRYLSPPCNPNLPSECLRCRAGSSCRRSAVLLSVSFQNLVEICINGALECAVKLKALLYGFTYTPFSQLQAALRTVPARAGQTAGRVWQSARGCKLGQTRLSQLLFPPLNYGKARVPAL